MDAKGRAAGGAQVILRRASQKGRRALRARSAALGGGGSGAAAGAPGALVKMEKREAWAYSVLNECPHEQDFTTLGLLILKPEPIRLSM